MRSATNRSNGTAATFSTIAPSDVDAEAVAEAFAGLEASGSVAELGDKRVHGRRLEEFALR